MSNLEEGRCGHVKNKNRNKLSLSLIFCLLQSRKREIPWSEFLTTCFFVAFFCSAAGGSFVLPRHGPNNPLATHSADSWASGPLHCAPPACTLGLPALKGQKGVPPKVRWSDRARPRRGGALSYNPPPRPPWKAEGLLSPLISGGRGSPSQANSFFASSLNEP